MRALEEEEGQVFDKTMSEITKVIGSRRPSTPGRAQDRAVVDRLRQERDDLQDKMVQIVRMLEKERSSLSGLLVSARKAVDTATEGKHKAEVELAHERALRRGLESNAAALGDSSSSGTARGGNSENIALRSKITLLERCFGLQVAFDITEQNAQKARHKYTYFKIWAALTAAKQSHEAFEAATRLRSSSPPRNSLQAEQSRNLKSRGEHGDLVELTRRLRIAEDQLQERNSKLTVVGKQKNMAMIGFGIQVLREFHTRYSAPKVAIVFSKWASLLTRREVSKASGTAAAQAARWEMAKLAFAQLIRSQRTIFNVRGLTWGFGRWARAQRGILRAQPQGSKNLPRAPSPPTHSAVHHMQSQPGEKGSTLSGGVRPGRTSPPKDRGPDGRRSPREKRGGDGGAASIVALLAAGTHELREIGAPAPSPPVSSASTKELEATKLMVKELQAALVESRSSGMSDAEKRELRDYKGELEGIYTGHKRSLDQKVRRLVKIYAFHMLADIREKTMQYLFRLGAAMSTWQAVVLETKVWQEADRYLDHSKQQLLTSFKFQLSHKEKHLQRALHIFAFHVLNEIMVSNVLMNRVAAFVSWRTLAQQRTNMRAPQEILQLERSGIKVAMELCDNERRYLTTALERAQNELRERRAYVHQRELEMQTLRREAERAEYLQERVESMEDVVRRTLREEKMDAQMEGWLKKLGTNTRMFTWSERWCMLRKGALCFWEDKPPKGSELSSPKTSIKLESIQDVSYCEQKPFAFKLVRASEEHPVFLEASSVEEREEWMRAITLGRGAKEELIEIEKRGMYSEYEGKISHLKAENQKLQLQLNDSAETALATIERLEERHEKFVAHTEHFDHGMWNWFERILLSKNMVDVPKGDLMEALSATLDSPSPYMSPETGQDPSMDRRMSSTRSLERHRPEKAEVDDWNSF